MGRVKVILFYIRIDFMDVKRCSKGRRRRSRRRCRKEERL